MLSIDIGTLSRFVSKLLKWPTLATPSMATHCSRKTNTVDQLYALVTRSKFRRTKVDNETSQDLREKIMMQVSAGEPICFSIPFGGYKNWRLESYPDPDWAEAFNLHYMFSYVAPLANIYSPGVALHYSYNDNVMDIVSNMPRRDQARYLEAFERLLCLWRQYLPANVSAELYRINDLYSPDEYQNELKENYRFSIAHWETKYSEEIRSKKVQSARHNLVLNGVEDLQSLSAGQLEQRYLRAAMYCDALDCLKKRRGFNKYSKNIQIVYIRGPQLSLHLGSCETSSMHFWVGTGVVEVRKGCLMQNILSAKRLTELTEKHRISFPKVNTELRTVSRVYRSIPIIL